MILTYSVDPDITQASTIASSFYRDETTYVLARQRVFARSWQWIGDLTDVAQPGSDGEQAFELPLESPDHGRRVAAYYYWVFPNLMLNFYPWGLSLNLIQPQALDRTRVSFRTYVWDPSKLDTGAGNGLDQVEMEDEGAVEAVQRGVRSHWYRSGRYSPTRERGVHHFHRLLCEFMADERPL